MDEAAARAYVLRVFGITEEEMAAFDAIDGYAAAKLQADEDRAVFLAKLHRLRAEIEADLTRALL